MRIIGGRFGGRVLRPSMKGWPTRPTTDISKEALYNILQNRIDFEYLRVLDLFGGTAAHSLECISRGSNDVTYVDNYNKCLKWAKEVAKLLEVEAELNIVRSDVRKYVLKEQGSFDFIFADPPYALPWIGTLPSLVLDNNLLASGGTLVIEHSSATDFSSHESFQEKRKYGQSVFSFFNA